LSTIQFTFEDLCAFFTGDPSLLIAGLIATDGEAPENVHHPHIIIRQGDKIVREYQEFTQINSAIYFDVYPSGQPLYRYVPISPDDPRRPLTLLVDIEKQLYPKQMLYRKIKDCRARLYFRSGAIYALEPVPVRFVAEKTGEPCPYAPTETALKVGLEARVPDQGYAVLHFLNQTEDFIFKGGQDFEVEVINAAQNKQLNHFKYLYDIVHPAPEPKWIPTTRLCSSVPPPGEGPQQDYVLRPRDIDATCVPGGYGDPPPPPPPDEP
jgi:hypothetical protein